MKEARFFYAPNAEDNDRLPPEEAAHALRVLRLKADDEIFLMDGKGCFFRAEVTLTSRQDCCYRITEELPQQKTWNGYIHLAIAPTKHIDCIEWMVEKATEIGFDELTFLQTAFTERKNIRVDRIEKIVVAAAKQSRNAWLPVVNDCMSMTEFLNAPHRGAKFIAHCYDDFDKVDLMAALQRDSNVNEAVVLVGPEGDFSHEEVAQALTKGFQSVSLGNSRLRTETAGLMAVTMAQLTYRR